MKSATNIRTRTKDVTAFNSFTLKSGHRLERLTIVNNVKPKGTRQIQKPPKLKTQNVQ